MPRSRAPEHAWWEKGLAVCLLPVLLLCACGRNTGNQTDPADAAAAVRAGETMLPNRQQTSAGTARIDAYSEKTAK